MIKQTKGANQDTRSSVSFVPSYKNLAPEWWKGVKTKKDCDHRKLHQAKWERWVSIAGFVQNRFLSVAYEEDTQSAMWQES